MNTAARIDIDNILPQLKLKGYTLEYVRTVLESVNDIGVNKTAVKFGISKTTIRMWRNPGRNKMYLRKNWDHAKDRLRKKVYYRDHYDKVLEAHKKYQTKRYHSDPNFRLRALIRTRVWRVIKDQKGEKLLRLPEYLGCTINEFRSHFESKFKEGMHWDNYGEWHIDHETPCSRFDLTTIDGQKACFHYSNLQPLWAEDNLTKSDK